LDFQQEQETFLLSKVSRPTIRPRSRIPYVRGFFLPWLLLMPLRMYWDEILYWKRNKSDVSMWAIKTCEGRGSIVPLILNLRTGQVYTLTTVPLRKQPHDTR